MAEQTQLLVPLDTYLKSGIHIGTKFHSAYMESFIYKIRPDGLAILNVQALDKRLAAVAKFLSQYKPEEILVVGKRENGWKAIKLFAKSTGIKVFAGNYPPGVLTNVALEDFVEVKVLLVTDPYPDKEAVRDAVKAGIVVIGLCDTNNESNGVDIVLACNNKGKKSLGLVFYVLARDYLMHNGKINDEKEMPIPLDKFMEEDEGTEVASAPRARYYNNQREQRGRRDRRN